MVSIFFTLYITLLLNVNRLRHLFLSASQINVKCMDIVPSRPQTGRYVTGRVLSGQRTVYWVGRSDRNPRATFPPNPPVSTATRKCQSMLKAEVDLKYSKKLIKVKVVSYL